MSKKHYTRKSWKTPKLNCDPKEFIKDPRLIYLKLSPKKRWLYLEHLQTSQNFPNNYIEKNILEHHKNVWHIFTQLNLKSSQYINSGQHKHVFMDHTSVIKIYNNSKLLNREKQVYTWLVENNFDDLTLPTTFFDTYSQSPYAIPLEDDENVLYNNFNKGMYDTWKYTPLFFNEYGLRITMKPYNLCIWNNQLRLIDIGEFVEKSSVTTDLLSVLQLARKFA